MRLGVTFNVIEGTTLEQKIMKVKDFGFTTAEIVAPFFGGPDPREAEPLFHEQGIILYGIGAYHCNPAHPDEKTREKLISDTTDLIAIASEVRGPPIVIIAPGGLDNEICWNFHKDNYSEKVFNLAVKNLRRICRVADEHNVAVALEPGSVTVGHSGKSLLRLIEHVGYEKLYVHMDACNMMSFPDRYARRGDYLNELFDELHGKIRGGHLKDVHLSEKGFSISGTLNESVAGDGELDWETYLYRLDGELGKDEPAALEHLKEKDVHRAKKFIEGISSKIGVNWTI